MKTEHGSAMIALCNVCGKPLDCYDLNQNFGFEYYIGYGSRHDFEHVRARFCCECFDKLLDRMILKCKINPVVGEYHLDGEYELDMSELEVVCKTHEDT